MDPGSSIAPKSSLQPSSSSALLLPKTLMGMMRMDPPGPFWMRMTPNADSYLLMVTDGGMRDPQVSTDTGHCWQSDPLSLEVSGVSSPADSGLRRNQQPFQLEPLGQRGPAALDRAVPNQLWAAGPLALPMEDTAQPLTPL